MYEFFGNLITEHVETLVFECECSVILGILGICRDSISDVLNLHQTKAEEKAVYLFAHLTTPLPREDASIL
jgi:hypothetical protein